MGSSALAISSVTLWVVSLQGIDAGRMNDLGLVSVLPWETWLALAMLTLSFILCWRRVDRPAWLLLLHVLLLVVMLCGLPALVTHEPIGPVVFRHAGITQNLIRSGAVNTKLDVYFSWPGFFAGSATLAVLAGVPSTLNFATWATLAFNILYLPPLLLLIRALTRDSRLIWGTVWVFYAANWIGQDYLAPQAFAYLLYLTILGLLLTYLRPHESDVAAGGQLARKIHALVRVRAADIALPPASGSKAAAIVALIVVLYSAVVVSHQLTPFAILVAVAALVALRQCTARGLPLVMAVILAFWIIVGARGYVSGHLAQLVASLGNFSQAASANLTERIGGSTLHLIVVRERLLLTGGLWLLALIGATRRFRRGYPDHIPAALALAPLLLFGMQVYGGEMLMRIYFFMLPFVAFFATAAFWPGCVSERTAPSLPSSTVRGCFIPVRTGFSWLRARLATTGFALTAGLLLGACLLARYGNERLDYFPPDEVAAVRFVYAHAQPGSTFVVERSYLPWKYEGYEQHRYLSIVSMLSHPNPPSTSQALKRISQDLRLGPGRPAGFVILTRSQRVYAEMMGGVTPLSYLDEFERLLRESPKFLLVYSSPNAQIYLRLRG